MKRPGLALIIAGALLVGIGLGLTQAGIRQARGPTPCEQSAETSAAEVAKASADLEGDDE